MPFLLQLVDAWRDSLILQFLKSSESISPCPVSSILYTSIAGDPGCRRIRQTPSSLTVSLSPVTVSQQITCRQFVSQVGDMSQNSHSRNAAAKLTHMSAFQGGFRPLFTVSGMLCVSISSTPTRMPSRERNPTMILGTPRRKDWIQYFMSLR